MTRADFVKAMKIQTSDASLSGTVKALEHVPGRKPKPSDVALSNWYKSLSDSDRAGVIAAMGSAAELAVFSFFCVIDGVSVMEDGPEKGELRLLYLRDGEELLLNAEGQEFLHDIYNALCQRSDRQNG